MSLTKARIQDLTLVNFRLRPTFSLVGGLELDGIEGGGVGGTACVRFEAVAALIEGLRTL